jgi:integrase
MKKGPRGLGSVYERGGVWWIQYRIHGKRYRESSGSTNRNIASRLLRKRIGAAESGRPVVPQLEKTTLEQITKMVATDYEANGRRSKDRVRYAIAHLHDFFTPEAKVVALTSDWIDAYKAHRQAQTFQGRPCSTATVNYELAVLRRGLHLGAVAGKVGPAPKVKTLHVENARKGFFEPEQHRAVVDHLPDYLKQVAEVAYITGWRTQSELLTRQWRHLDFEAGWLRLDPGESKNGKARNFPFTPELRTALEAQREYVRRIEMQTGAIIPWVFVHPDGSIIKSFRYAWKKACASAAVPGRLVHDLRRTAVRNLERAGVSRSAAMEMTGHKTETVFRRYAIVDSAMLQEAATKLSKLHQAENRSPAPKVVPLKKAE